MPGVQEERRLADAQKKEHEAIMEGRLEKLWQMRRDIKEIAKFRAARDAALAAVEAAV